VARTPVGVFKVVTVAVGIVAPLELTVSLVVPLFCNSIIPLLSALCTSPVLVLAFINTDIMLPL
jgi:hypothetical protein